jgi:hypothetical protein
VVGEQGVGVFTAVPARVHVDRDHPHPPDAVDQVVLDL